MERAVLIRRTVVERAVSIWAFNTEGGDGRAVSIWWAVVERTMVEPGSEAICFYASIYTR